ncbi:MAG: GDP-mannose 4,6-dehydratase, partial [Flavobacteriaceae bacterium]|nr:GDP-mannose 4,6-dehydratase [Flavobacteriaceae bacterium]
MKVLITGGAGFIGSHVLSLFVENYPQYNVFNLDALTYAGNLENLKKIESKPNYTFIKGDITDENFINTLFEHYKFDRVIHLAAESHVDRSIKTPLDFIKTNILGTTILLNAIKTKAYPTPAKRPVYSVIDKTKVKSVLGIEILNWQDR